MKRDSSFFEVVVEGFAALSEKNAISIFCRNSETLKTMQKDSLAVGASSRNQNFIQAIKEANTFSDMLPLIDNFHPSREKESVAIQAVIKTVLFFGSYVNSDIDFIYHLPALKKEIINYAVEHGYEINYQRDNSYTV
ncbi:Uncharacterised protein [Legionella beliardensis]|uniref:Uncharacterized protein n=1 Tax=Legionella beliardensis TaxID=91822 RepID=A0A378IAC4_9GAMM|nr:hypothetical protein [Legionella beliardensis]STX29294.1 Uncharacterised protein [Legionella beliardensis]